jgi:hypothetical protein
MQASPRWLLSTFSVSTYLYSGSLPLQDLITSPRVIKANKAKIDIHLVQRMLAVVEDPVRVRQQLAMDQVPRSKFVDPIRLLVERNSNSNNHRLNTMVKVVLDIAAEASHPCKAPRVVAIKRENDDALCRVFSANVKYVLDVILGNSRIWYLLIALGTSTRCIHKYNTIGILG